MSGDGQAGWSGQDLFVAKRPNKLHHDGLSNPFVDERSVDDTLVALLRGQTDYVFYQYLYDVLKNNVHQEDIGSMVHLALIPRTVGRADLPVDPAPRDLGWNHSS